MVDDDAVDLVRHVIEPVDHFLQMIVHLVADEEVHRVGAAGLLELLLAGVVLLVGAPFERRDLLGQRADTTRFGRNGTQ